MSIPIVGPVPPYTNPPIQPQNYKPRVFNITGITLTYVTVVTTSVANNYVIGQQVRLVTFTPALAGINGLQGIIIEINSPTVFTLNVESTGLGPIFNILTGSEAQVVAIGDINTGAINTNGRVNQSTSIPGSFINISPA